MLARDSALAARRRGGAPAKRPHDEAGRTPSPKRRADKDARVYRKDDGQESRLAYLGHALMENHSGLVAAAEAALATGTAEREAAGGGFQPALAQGDLGAEKGYDAEAFEA